MPEISLTDFVDYSLASGPTQLAKVRELKRRPEYDPKRDYWKGLRDALVDLETGVLSFAEVEQLVLSVAEVKRQRYQEGLTGFRAFAKKRPGESRSRPRRTEWTHAGLVVRVNPELCYRTEEGSLCVKMYFKAEPVTKHKSEATLLLMSEALPKHRSGLLVVRTGKLISSDLSKADLDVYLRAQATALWRCGTLSPDPPPPNLDAHGTTRDDIRVACPS